jgi:hypothetical protein
MVQIICYTAPEFPLKPDMRPVIIDGVNNPVAIQQFRRQVTEEIVDIRRIIVLL